MATCKNYLLLNKHDIRFLYKIGNSENTKSVEIMYILFITVSFLCNSIESIDALLVMKFWSIKLNYITSKIQSFLHQNI